MSAVKECLITIPDEGEQIVFGNGLYNNPRAIDYEAKDSKYQLIKLNGFKMESGWSIYFKLPTKFTLQEPFIVVKCREERFQTIRLEAVYGFTEGSYPVIKMTNDGPFIFKVESGITIGEIYSL